MMMVRERLSGTAGKETKRKNDNGVTELGILCISKRDIPSISATTACSDAAAAATIATGGRLLRSLEI